MMDKKRLLNDNDNDKDKDDERLPRANPLTHFPSGGEYDQQRVFYGYEGNLPGKSL